MVLTILLAVLTFSGEREVKLSTKDFISEGIHDYHHMVDDLLFIATDFKIYAFSTVDGRLLGQFGSAGDGPAQFETIATLGSARDSEGQQYLVVNDTMRWDLSVFKIQRNGKSIDFKYIGRFNRNIRNIWPIANGFAVSDIKGLATKDPKRFPVVTANNLSISGTRIIWKDGVSFYHFPELAEEVGYSSTAHFFHETKEAYLVGFAMDPQLYTYSKSGQLMDQKPLHLYRFKRIEKSMMAIKNPHEWHSRFSEIFMVRRLSGQTMVYFSAPKPTNWKLVKPRQPYSMPTITNHDTYIQWLEEGKIYKVQEKELVVEIRTSGGQYYAHTVELDDSGFYPVYFYRVRQLNFSKPSK